VRKVYPDSLEVRIEEREPFAIWQHGDQLQIVGREGNVITPFSGGRHAALPLVTGYGAVDHAIAFVEKVGRYPELSARVKGYVRVSERRWNLRLENGITVKLPEAGQDAALADLLRMDRESGLLSRDIVAVDMRLAERLVVQLSPEAETKRNVALGDLFKASKGKAGKKI
nr:cell division protein FtsQ/DivIB [Pseudaminobacter sp.]